VTVSFWGSDTFTKPTDWVQKFQDKYPNIKLDMSSQDPEKTDKFLTAIGGGQPPDLLFTDRAWVKDLASKEALTALDDMAKKSDQFSADNFFPKMWDDVHYQGKMYAAPTWTDARAFYYNTDLLQKAGLDPQKPPTTWEEIQTYADKLTQKDSSGNLQQLGFVSTWGNPPGFLVWYLYAWQLGGDLASSDGLKSTYSSKESKDAVSWMLMMIDRYGGYEKVSAFASSFTPGQNQDAFTIGKVAMQVDGDWKIPNLKKYSPDVKYGVSPLPLPPSGHVTNYAGGFSLTLPKGTKQPDAGWQFISWFDSKEALLPFCVDQFVIPTVKAVANDPEYLKVDPKMKVFVDTLPGAKWVPVGPGLAEILDITSKALDSMLHHQQTVDQACADADTKVQAIFDKERK
jgi:multiple sugar transport system substrate-binding protein